MITIDRFYQPDVTLGRLRINDFQCFTLELPWKNNENSISCIPEGNYEYFLRESPTNGMVLELKGTKHRTNIQIHKGNYTRNIKGCILVGESIKFLDGDTIPDVTNSKNTLKKLLAVVPNIGTINIRK